MPPLSVRKCLHELGAQYTWISSWFASQSSMWPRRLASNCNPKLVDLPSMWSSTYTVGSLCSQQYCGYVFCKFMVARDWSSKWETDFIQCIKLAALPLQIGSISRKEMVFSFPGSCCRGSWCPMIVEQIYFLQSGSEIVEKECIAASKFWFSAW
jgi:hypothetical protein